MTKQEALIDYCANRIRGRLYLKNHGWIEISIRSFEGPDARGHYKIQPKYDVIGRVIEPAEFWCEDGYFNRVKAKLDEEYPQLHRDTERKVPLKAFLIEPLFFFGSTWVGISGGFNWLIMGVLKNGEKYCAVLDAEVRPLLQRCGLMSLMKHAEIALSRREGCDFIQTWHTIDNPDFNAAIVPSLKRGFILYHGDNKDGEDYEDRGYVHLRYYLDRKKRRNVTVWFKDGKEFISPRDNDSIMHDLESCPDVYPGRQIWKIEKYEKADTEVRRRKKETSADNEKKGPGKQRIYIADGVAGFEGTRQRNTYRVSDSITFCPAVMIDHYVKTKPAVPYMKHIIYNIYELRFRPVAMVHFKYQDGIVGHFYIIETFPGFRLSHCDWKRGDYLTVGQWYEGHGRLAIRDHRDYHCEKSPITVKDCVMTGNLVGISQDLIKSEFSRKYSDQVKRFRYSKDVYCDEDALEWFGYYKDLKKFRKKVSSFLKNPVEYESTDAPKSELRGELIFCIELEN